MTMSHKSNFETFFKLIPELFTSAKMSNLALVLYAKYADAH